MPKRSLAALATGTALVTGVLALPPSAQASATPHAIPNSAPTWTAHAQHLGKASPSASVDARVYLAPRGGFAALRAAAVAVSTPGSATYRHFLSASQYTARFAPTSAAVSSVESWLRSSGLKVTSVESHHRYVAVHGTVAQANKAFATSIERYSHNGQSVQAPNSTVHAPGAVAASVLTVTGLDTTVNTMKTHNVTPDAHPGGFRNARPCSTTFGQLIAKREADNTTPLPRFQGKYLPYAVCGYTGPYLRQAYENGDVGGSGVTVGITDAYASQSLARDAETYANRNGDGGYAPGQLVQQVPSSFHAGGLCNPTGWFGEETLDVEAVHAMAPQANIRYYGARSCLDSDLSDTLAKVVDQDQVQLVSNSWGDLEQNATSGMILRYEQIFLQGAVEGISFLFSSGDNGDELANSGAVQADYPTSDPYVTSVGGTTDGIGRGGVMEFQTGWGTHNYSLASDGSGWVNHGFLYGAGGGYSKLFNRPSYQDGVVGSSYRGVPDVGLLADPNDGMLIGITQQFPEGTHYDEYRIGGTSLASPLFAGMTAVAFGRGGTSAGLLNPTIYQNSDTSAFHDVKGTPPVAGVVRVNFNNGIDASNGLSYLVRTLDQDSSLTTGKGWDDVTGVGSPTPAWLDVFTTK